MSRQNDRIAQYGDMSDEEINDGFESVINVTKVLNDEGSVILFGGFDHNTGEAVIFAADHRPAQGLASIVLNGELALASVEQWQILSRRPAPPKAPEIPWGDRLSTLESS